MKRAIGLDLDLIAVLSLQKRTVEASGRRRSALAILCRDKLARGVPQRESHVVTGFFVLSIAGDLLVVTLSVYERPNQDAPDRSA